MFSSSVKTLIYSNGIVYGNAVVGGSADLSPSVGFQSGGMLQFATPIDFAMAQAELQASCTSLSSIDSTGMTSVHAGTISLIGSEVPLNVFEVSMSDLNSAHTLRLNIPAGATALVNVVGAGLVEVANMGFSYGNTSPTQVLFTICAATELEIRGVGIEGSVLAPQADISFNAAVISGQLIGRSLTGFGQSNHGPFEGCEDILAELGGSSLLVEVFDRTRESRLQFRSLRSEGADLLSDVEAIVPRAVGDR